MLNKNILQVTQEVGYLENILLDEKQKNEFVLQYLKPLLHSGLGKILKGVKSKGFSPIDIIQFLSMLPLLGLSTIGSIWSSIYTSVIDSKKDVLYRLKNNAAIPWRKLLYSISRRFLRQASLGQSSLEEGSQKPSCLIFDDTDIEKTGTAIEGVSKVWSHVRHGYILGFKLLTLGFFDGISFISLDFSLHREQGDKKINRFGLPLKKLQKQFYKIREVFQAGYERKAELDDKKTDTILKMMIQAVKKVPVKIDYVLCDSWFFNYTLLKWVVRKMNLICGVKMGKINFEYNGKNYSAKSLVKVVIRKIKYSKKLKAHYIPLLVKYKGIPIRLFYVKYGNQKKWRIIISSDTKLSFIKTLEIYQIRWSIEVFFKEMKQYLGLNKCQSRNFDAHIAHISLAMILHTALTLKKRVDCHQTMGQLFREVKSELIELTIAQRLWKLFVNIIHKLTDLFDFDPKDLFQKLSSNHFSKIESLVLKI